MTRPSRQLFNHWFQALNQNSPFPWQERLFLNCLCPDDPESAHWPRTISLPTASGKTSLIDLAVLALACNSPCARRRIVFVVDRRLVVDEAARRAERIAAALKRATTNSSDPLHGVAQSLVKLGGDPEEPLLVSRLRGGIHFDDSWARNPAQPAVILSTVDQVGSRLLFRAYGPVSPKAWSIPAGLLGLDTLILVDEAHCAKPFCQTLEEIESRWQHWAEDKFLPSLIAVQLSATLASSSAEFELDAEDLQCTALSNRLTARKPVFLISVSAQKKKKSSSSVSPERAAIEEEITARASAWLSQHSQGVLAVVVNRVASARRIYDALPLPEHQKLLLTGRARPWERDHLLQSWLPRLQAGRAAADATYAVVATQCIEVGADFDFDFMISEAASLDALRQRFGRLDRLGQRERRLQLSPSEPAGLIIAADSQVDLDGDSKAEPDPVYGRALADTWEFLRQFSDPGEKIDFSHASISQALDRCSNYEGMLQPSPSAYPLLPAYLDLLAQTSPPPEPDVEVSAFLHGATAPSADVLIVWRADLDPSRPDSWVDRVSIQPPLPGEACTVPIWEARHWLESLQSLPEEANDLEEPPVEAGNKGEHAGAAARPALAWRGPEDSLLRRLAEDIRAGDVLVVPAQYGGCTKFGWDPSSPAPVSDIADAVAVSVGRRPVLRLASLRQLLSAPLPSSSISSPEEPIPPTEDLGSLDVQAPEPALRSIVESLEQAVADPDTDDTQQSALINEALHQLKDWAAKSNIPWLEKLAGDLHQDQRRDLEIDPHEGLVAIIGSRTAIGEAETATDAAQFRRISPVSLDDHTQGVKQKVEEFAQRLSLPPAIQKALTSAALFHDVGKSDPRFQAWLRGGLFFSGAQNSDLLAKSGAISSRNLPAILRARQLSGYPEGARHEALSSAIASQLIASLDPGIDQDLLLHLIESHHGYARPWFQIPEPSRPLPLQIELYGRQVSTEIDYVQLQAEPAVVDRFWRLNRRYGWWGLAFLEAVLRLADQRRSASEESNAKTR